MQGKVDICGVNTSRLTVLTQAETDMLLRRVKVGTRRQGRSSSRGICGWCWR